MGTARTSPKVVRQRRALGIKPKRGKVLRHFPKSRRKERAGEALARKTKVEAVSTNDIDWVDEVLEQEVEFHLEPVLPPELRNRRSAVIPKPVRKPQRSKRKTPELIVRSSGLPTVGQRVAEHSRNHCRFRIRGDRKHQMIAKAILPDDADPATFTHADIEWLVKTLGPAYGIDPRDLNLSAIRNELEWLVWDRDGWRDIDGRHERAA